MESPIKPSRRRLVRGTLAVPLVLTVRAAQGQGVAASSAMACLARDSARAGIDQPKEILPVDTDDWMRTSVDLLRVFHWVNGNQTLVDDNKYFLGRDNVFWRLVESIGSISATASEWNTSNSFGEPTGEQRFALIHVNALGEPVSFAFEKIGGSAVTTSCSVSATAARLRRT